MMRPPTNGYVLVAHLVARTVWLALQAPHVHFRAVGVRHQHGLVVRHLPDLVHLRVQCLFLAPSGDHNCRLMPCLSTSRKGNDRARNTVVMFRPKTICMPGFVWKQSARLPRVEDRLVGLDVLVALALVKLSDDLRRRRSRLRTLTSLFEHLIRQSPPKSNGVRCLASATVLTLTTSAIMTVSLFGSSPLVCSAILHVSQRTQHGTSSVMTSATAMNWQNLDEVDISRLQNNTGTAEQDLLREVQELPRAPFSVLVHAAPSVRHDQ